MERKIYSRPNRNEWLILRTTDLTSTDMAALFNLSPYMTSFELWHRKKDATVVELEENERMKWGNRLESAIAIGIGEDQGWDVKPFKDYISIKSFRLGSSFDYIASIPDKPDSKNFILEIKNVDSLAYKDGWLVDGDSVEAPPHIELQIQHQMLVSGYDTAFIGALIGGNKVILIERKADAKIQKAMLDKAAVFWDSIDKNQVPKPNFKRDAAFISKLYNYAEPGKIFEADDNAGIEDLVTQYRMLAQRVKKDKIEQDAIKAEILTIVGDCEKIVGDGFTISAGVVGEAPISYIRKAYRSFRIFTKKLKEKVNA